MTDTKWGPGNKVNDKSFDTATVGTERFELFFGEHPHSRQDNNTYARASNGEVTTFSGHRWPVSIEIEEYNYLKSSGLSGNDISRGCQARVKIDGKHVYTLNQTRDHVVALTRLPEIVDKLMEHPVRLWKEEDLATLVGRTVFYRDQPAIVERWDVEEGVLLVSESGGFRPAPWSSDSADKADESASRVYCDVLSPNIYWWRDVIR